MSNTQLTIDSAIGTFIALMLTEAIVKPVARQTGRWILHKLDHRVKFIPDWLSGHDPSEGKTR